MRAAGLCSRPGFPAGPPCACLLGGHRPVHKATCAQRLRDPAGSRLSLGSSGRGPGRSIPPHRTLVWPAGCVRPRPSCSAGCMTDQLRLACRPPDLQRRLILSQVLLPGSDWNLFRRSGAGWRSPLRWGHSHPGSVYIWSKPAQSCRGPWAHFLGFSIWLQRPISWGAFKNFSSCETLLIFSIRLVTEGDRIYNELSYPHINDQLNSRPSCFIYTLHNSPYIVLNPAKKVVFSFLFFLKYKSQTHP